MRTTPQVIDVERAIGGEGWAMIVALRIDADCVEELNE